MPLDGRLLRIPRGSLKLLSRRGLAMPTDRANGADDFQPYFRAKIFAVNSPVGMLYVPSKRVFAPLRNASLVDCV